MIQLLIKPKYVICTPRYSWNIAKVGVEHQSINQLINHEVRRLQDSCSICHWERVHFAKKNKKQLENYLVHAYCIIITRSKYLKRKENEYK